MYEIHLSQTKNNKGRLAMLAASSIEMMQLRNQSLKDSEGIDIMTQPGRLGPRGLLGAC